jgi:hypothetical protein
MGFPPESTPPAPRRRRTERREFPRVPPGQRTSCLVGTPGERPQVNAVLHNLNVKGAGVLSEKDYPAGTTLEVLLVNGANTCSLTASLRVVHSGPAAGGLFYLGGVFEPPPGHAALAPFMV